MLTDTEVCGVEGSDLDDSEHNASTTGRCLESLLEASPLETPPLEASPLETPPPEASPLETPPPEASPLETPPPEASPLDTQPLNGSVSSADSDEDESDSEGTVSGAELEDLRTLNQSLRPFRDKLTSGSDKGIIILVQYRFY